MNLEGGSPQERLPQGSHHPLPDPGRSSASDLARDVERARGSRLVATLLDAADTSLMVLNPRREIVAANASAASLRPLPEIIGLRPGEALSCVVAGGPGGCGTTAHCETCGALGAILASQERGRPVGAECLMRSELGAGAALEFHVRATPLDVEGWRLTAVSLRDISSEKRREALEQVFFHDVLNTVAGLRGWTQVLLRSGGAARACERVDLLSRHLEREICDHRALVRAERGTLVPDWRAVGADEVLREVEAVSAASEAARGRTIEVDPAPEVALRTDPALLVRVLVNMVRNGLEATEAGGLVRAWCEGDAAGVAGAPGGGTGGVWFRVRNPAVIAPEVQERIFQRSFSTKAPRGRGLGTYSMKLLGERYLGGEVSFLSTPREGTVFSIRLPRDPAAT